MQRLRLSPCAQGFGAVLADFDTVFNGGAAAGAAESAAQAAVERWPGLGVPGPLANGYAHRRPGMDWSIS